MELLNASVSTFCYVTKMNHLKTCLETPEFDQFFDVLKKKLIPQPSRKYLESKGYTKDDFYTIDSYTKLFKKMHKQPIFSGRAPSRRPTQNEDSLGENESGFGSAEEETGKIDRGGQQPGRAGGMRLRTKRSQHQRMEDKKRFKP